MAPKEIFQWREIRPGYMSERSMSAAFNMLFTKE